MYQEAIRDVLKAHGRLSVDVTKLGHDSDLYDAGLTSLATVNLLLAIEDRFDVEFPDHALNRSTFQSIGSLANVVAGLLE